jgi:hypothetical protein
VKPNKESFDMIYRSAMGVKWNKEGSYLFYTKSVKWSLFQWYEQIIKAVISEYETLLTITDETIYENIDGETINLIKKQASPSC